MSLHRVVRDLAARRSAGRSVIPVLLVLALLVYGFSGTLLRMVGPAHRHTPSADAAANAPALLESAQAFLAPLRHWHEQARGQQLRLAGDPQARHMRTAALEFALQQLDDPGNARQHVQDQPHVHTHEHAGLERHFHDPGDRSVVITLDGSDAVRAAVDSLSSAAALGSAMLPFALPTALFVPPAPGRRQTWPSPVRDAWRSAMPRLAERPPAA